MMNRIFAAAAAAALALAAAGPAHADWIESWGASPLPADGGFFGPPPSFEDQTIRQVVRLSAGGEQVRIAFTNEYGAQPLTIGAATVTLAEEDGTPAGDPVALTFSGAQSVTIPAGAPYYSDPVTLEADDLASLSVSIYLPDATGPCTCHLTGAQTAYVAAGDRTGDAGFVTEETLIQRVFLTGVDVQTEGEGKTIVALGDSITDGVGATTDANDRWPDVLAERLAARGGDVAWGVSNQGISGNRLLAGGAGESILSRLDRDVLAVPGAEYVIVFIGVNDLGIGFGNANFATTEPGAPVVPVNLETMTAAYRQVIDRAHMSGLTVYGATIAPYEGATYWSAEGEALRSAINDWIRDSGAFDGVIDFDAAVRDPADPGRFLADYHMGDWLHGSPEGYAVMGGAVDLDMFE